MSFAAAIRRTPLPHDAEAGAEAAAHLPGQPPEVAEVLRGAGGSSPHLRGLIEKEADWLDGALAAEPAAILPGLLAETAALPDADLSPGLRCVKRRLALYAGLADLAGVWPLETVTHALTAFADAAVDRALRSALAGPLSRGKVPGHGGGDIADAAGMCVLAMGKMGAFELNYSSDIDLIVLFDDSRFEGADIAEARAVFIKATRAMTATLQEQTGDGYVWRTDLRLRPDPSVTPVCLAMEAAERYYESLGRTWERAAHIKARPSAGDLAAGEAYLERLRPFVWRRHLDYAAIEDAHDMRRRIRDHKGLHEASALEGRDLKLGHGGIRAIEFFTQTRQLIAGGRDPALRVRGTEEGLARLAERGWIPGEVADELRGHYRALREAEHRVQQVADARTHLLPADAAGFDRLARLSGEGDTARFRAGLAERMDAVHRLTEGFFSRAEGLAGAPGPAGAGDEPEIVARWRHYPALRSSRAQAIFERLKPDLLARLQAADRPEEAMTAFDGFLRGLPAGVQLFSMFEANPQLRALIVDIAATAPALAQYLSRNARVLEAVVSGSFFAPWPGRDALRRELADVLARDRGDYEHRLDAARRWAKEWHFRAGVHHLRGLTDAAEAGRQYADLAAAILAALLPVVVEHFADKHGAPPGRGVAVFGMGSLGAGWLTAGSDLDLIVIYDPAGEEGSDGPRPLSSRPYYARLTQALVTALTAPTAAGKLYEVDMRLRPSGRQGPVATALAAFEAYQREEAWTWEHMALTRAACVAGSPQVCAEAEAVRAAVLGAPRAPAQVWMDLAKMRARLAGAKPPKGPLDVKPGPGGLQDIELVGQAAALLAGSTARRTAAQLDAAARAGLMPRETAESLKRAYRFARSVQSAGRLLVDGPLAPEALGQGARAVLCRETGMADLAALEARLAEERAEAAALIDAAVTGGVEVQEGSDAASGGPAAAAPRGRGA
ncbi:glutamine-synthetase adenylyltransferase [Rhodovulum sp. 12E13]|uniref:[protein-PII] uridylyltransferase family protein n=1 Tax=Rhodovulum sp. 12E13 TaxID=2203891 RepID=UPI000E1486D0|nr:putative nucleotidyltransferase substrate binding domain-containing protein [Rhodovulum sp. 12E13]RDC72433.1 glutamine-synthetase adenylyltransferase [Rhodovulum sp. 12E13]